MMKKETVEKIFHIISEERKNMFNRKMKMINYSLKILIALFFIVLIYGLVSCEIRLNF